MWELDVDAHIKNYWKKIEELDSISSGQLLEVLDGLPEEHQHCARLAVSTLYKVIKDYHKKEDNVKIKFF
jgi:NifU-like protein involved in Fe-S cluster formation